MSHNLKQYRAIKQALKQLYSKEPQGNLARHLDTLADLISGIVWVLPLNAVDNSQVPIGDEPTDARIILW